MTDDLRARFQDPSATWRAIPFWSLNDVLEPAEMVRQLEAFARGGFGGAYLHSRIGLLTPYLGDAWWTAMDAGADACERLGIEAWFYDEDKWPSGFAGGIVPLQGAQHRARWLARIPLADPVPAGGEVLAEDARWRYVCCVAAMGDAWFNGTCWVDLLNPDTVRAFIDCTYEPYARRYADRPRHILRGIFTDEPQVSPRGEVPGAATVPYSPIVRADFLARNGYDLAEHLPALYEPLPGHERVRLDYFRTLAWRFEQSFSAQIGRYCAGAGLTWTGHYNGEEHSLSVLRNVGNMMIQYRHMQQPGIDYLGLHFGGMHGVHAMRSLSSVANQYGQERRLSEMFGISGQNMDFEDRAWIADGHAVMGINHICPHLSLYSMKGCRKRDYPPTISPQQPWWDSNRLAEDRMARVAMLSSQGSYAAELLVVHPLESAYIEIVDGGSGDQPAVHARFNAFLQVLSVLQDAHRDYDLGDEQILADVGSAGPDGLRVGRMTYRAVVLPPLLTIRAGTIDRILAAAAHGCPVLAVGALPALVDGLAQPALLERLRRVARVVSCQGLADALAAALPPAVQIAGEHADQVWIHRRDVGGRPLVMLFNRSRLATARVRLGIAGLADPLCWDPTDGTCRPVGGDEVVLASAQTLFIGHGALCPPDRRDPARGGAGAPGARFPITGPWAAGRRDDNALTLDVASASLDGGRTFGPVEPVLGLHERFTRDRWSGRLVLRFAVRIDVVPERCDLVVEQPGMYRRIAVNGTAVSADARRFWRDGSFRCCPAGPALVRGDNLIELELDYVAPVPDSLDQIARYGSEIEAVYLVGPFAVAAEPSPEPPAPTQRSQDRALPPVPVHRMRSFRIAAEPTAVAGDLVTAGYPFFAGSFTIATSFDLPAVRPGVRYVLRLGRPHAIVVHPRVNGVDLAPVAWSPWETDVTAQVRAGRNELALTLVNSLRNLLGPHHHRDGELTRVGPNSFTGRTTWTSVAGGEEDWYDVRLEGRTKIWRDDYHLIPFGLGGVPEIVEILPG